MAGTSRATVNRVLRDEEKRGAVALGRGRVTVLDAEELGSPATSGPWSPPLRRQVVEECAEQTVEALRAGDTEPLARRVGAFDVGSDRDHLNSRQAASEDRALQATMDDLELRLGLEQT